jgi:hypothetical protein
MEKPLIGAYFGFRDYFHGQGIELLKDAPAPAPIASPYRSAVFRSQPENVLAVAFSVPIYAEANAEKEVSGVLVMETILSNISDFRGNRKQSAVLVDLRPDQLGKRGLIVDHPLIASSHATGLRPEEYYLSDTMLSRISRIHQEHLSRVGPVQSLETKGVAAVEPIPFQHESIIDNYDDPLTKEIEQDCFAAVEPVFVPKGDEAAYDTGWSILIQEQRADTVAPLSRVWSLIVRGGTIGLILVLALLSMLWGFVLFVNNRPTNRPIVKWGADTPSGLSSHASNPEGSPGEGTSSSDPSKNSR